MAGIWIPSTRVIQPQTPVSVKRADSVVASFPLKSAWFLANSGTVSADAGTLFAVRTASIGTVWDGQANLNSFAIGLPSGSKVYGILLAFDLSVAALTSASANAIMLFNFGTASVKAGPSTSLLTGETIAILDPGSGRTGTDASVALGKHILCIQWNGTKYEVWIDGAFVNQLSGSSGDCALITTSAATTFAGRTFSGDPRICPALTAISTSPAVDFRNYRFNPWELFEDERTFIPLGGSTTPTLSAATAAWSWGGQAANLSTQLSSTAAAWSWAGQAANLSTQIGTAVGAYAWGGVSATLSSIPQVNASIGAMSWAGQTASLSTQLNSTIGAWTWAGTPSALSTQVGATVGAWAWTGTGATVSTVPNLNSTAGTYSWNGQTASLSWQIGTASGAYTWAGINATVSSAPGVLPMVSAIFAMTSHSATNKMSSYSTTMSTSIRRATFKSVGGQ